MILAKKVRLLPTPEQERQLWKSAGTARYIYNWALNKQIKHFESTGKLSKISDGNLRKELTKLKQEEKYAWLYEVSNNVAKQAVKDLCNAIDKFHTESKKQRYKYRKSAIKTGKELTIQDFEYFPKFKSRKKSKTSFYHDTGKLKVYSHEVKLEKIGKVKLAEKERIPIESKYTNPRITHDGKYWYISVGVEEVESTSENTDIALGVDVGIKDLAICSNDMVFRNINKTKEVKRLKKKLKRKQKQISRQYEKSKKMVEEAGENRYEYTKTNNTKKREKEVKLIHRRLSNIRLNHIHQSTSKIVKAKPSRIVVEDLNIKGMMKNRHLSKAIQEQCLYKFISILEYKSKFNNIEFVKADRFYPSSKTCSNCGEVKKDLKLKDRVFICPKCNVKIDRDKNASINLSKYEKLA